MKNSPNKTKTNKKKYLGALPLLLGASALVPNQAAASEIRCNATLDGDVSATYTCGSEGSSAYEDNLTFVGLYPNKNNEEVSVTQKDLTVTLDDKDAERINTTVNATYLAEDYNYNHGFSVTSNYSGAEPGSINVDLINSGILAVNNQADGDGLHVAAIHSATNVKNITVKVRNGVKEIRANSEPKGSSVDSTNGINIENLQNHGPVGGVIDLSLDTKVSAFATSKKSFATQGINVSNASSNGATRVELKDNANVTATGWFARGINYTSSLAATNDAVLNFNGHLEATGDSTTRGVEVKGYNNVNLNFHKGELVANTANTNVQGVLVQAANNVTLTQEQANKIETNSNEDYLNFQLGHNTAIEINANKTHLDLAGTTVSKYNAIEVHSTYIPKLVSPSNMENTVDINIRDGAVVKAGRPNYYLINTGSNTKVSNITIGKADIQGSVLLEGTDEVANLTFNGTDLSKVATLEASATGVSTLNLNNYAQAVNLDAANLHHWKKIKATNSTINLEGDKLVFGERTTDYGLYLDNSTLNLNHNAREHAFRSFNVYGHVYNKEGSVIDLRNSNPGHFNSLIINAPYQGGGTVILNVEANGDNSKSDVLAINDAVVGTTKVEVYNKGGKGSLTDKGIKIIDLITDIYVENGANAFVLTNSLDAGLYEYNTLSYDSTPGIHGFYLKSEKTGKNPSTAATSGSEERGTTITVNGKKVEGLFRKVAPAYVLAQQINSQALADLTTNLYQREGEQRAQTNYSYPNQSWVRYLGNQRELKVYNLGAKTTNFGVQVGYDFKTTYSDNFRNRAGVYAAYNKVDSTLSDTDRKELHIPGRVDTSLGSLALYNTSNFGNGYVDVVGGFHLLHSDYEIINGGGQNAFGGNLSVEAGYNLDLGNHFFIEPQLQLSYQGTHYVQFKDHVTTIKGYTHHSLRPRGGFRLGYHDVAGTNLWLHANLETELLKTAKLTIGTDVVSVGRAAKTIYDLGLNGQVDLSPTTILYGSAQYKGSLDKGQTLSSGKKVKVSSLKGFGGEIGLRFTW